MKNTIMILLTLIFCGQLFAQENVDLNSMKIELTDASSITDDMSRLAKYDEILIKYKLKELSENQTESNWDVSVDTDPIDDSKQIIFILKADSGESDYGNPTYLIIRYSNNESNLFANWGDYLGSEAFVTMRVGADKASTRKWSLSTDSKATFFPGNPIELIKKIMSTDKLVMQCTPYNSNPITAVFNVSGLKEEAEIYMDDLNWF